LLRFAQTRLLYFGRDRWERLLQLAPTHDPTAAVHEVFALDGITQWTSVTFKALVYMNGLHKLGRELRDLQEAGDAAGVEAKRQEIAKLQAEALEAYPTLG
jgi:hypothetical protein